MNDRRSPHVVLRSLAAWCLAAAACGGGSAPATERTPAPRTHQVIMEGTAFVPPSLTVRSGDSIEWINRDFFPHTATSTEARFDSKSVDAGASWKYTLTEKGEFAYVCTLHPTMKGTIRVE